jgi:hypothetical protein
MLLNINICSFGVRREVCGVRHRTFNIRFKIAAYRVPRTASRNQQIPDRSGLGSPAHAHRQELQFKVWTDLKKVFHCLSVYFYHLPVYRD